MEDFFKAAKSAWQNASDTNAGLLSAGVAYYAFLSSVPLLASSVLTYGLFVDPSQLARHAAEIAQLMPQNAARNLSPGSPDCSSG